jgi:hypothetical protein
LQADFTQFNLGGDQIIFQAFPIGIVAEAGDTGFVQRITKSAS